MATKCLARMTAVEVCGQCLVTLTVLCAALGLFCPARATAVRPPYFRAYADLQLCPDYDGGRVSLEMDYRIGNAAQRIPLVVVPEEVDLPANRGRFRFELPSIYGRTELHLTAYCRNTSGRSLASNSVSLSNCDALSVVDSDKDGITDDIEDSDCSNSFNLGDLSNSDSIDTDGDGVRDLVEAVEGADPANAGSSPRPIIVADQPFDPDYDGDSNPVVWRKSQGMWFIRDFYDLDQHASLQFGIPGDIPFIYRSGNSTSDVGVIRNVDNSFHWYFHGAGFPTADLGRHHLLPFGQFGDKIVLGPWQDPAISNPAVARLHAGSWSFYVYQNDGTIRHQYWGVSGDIPKVQDYDGDGIFDVAVYRPSELTTYAIGSTDGGVRTYRFGSGTADHTFKGDVDGNGTDDITFWEPASGVFTTLSNAVGSGTTTVVADAEKGILTVDTQADRERRSAETKNLVGLFQMQLGLYYVHRPLSWNMQNGQVLYTVVDHQTGLRYVRRNNDPQDAPTWIQWGLPGDAQG